MALRDVLNSQNLAATFTVSMLDTKRNITGVRFCHSHSLPLFVFRADSPFYYIYFDYD